MTTHHDLLARIDELHNEGNFGIPRATSTYYPKVEKIYKALRAVVEIHAPRNYKPGFRDVKGTLHYVICGGCSDRSQEPVKFPCFEFSTIEKELG